MLDRGCEHIGANIRTRSVNLSLSRILRAVLGALYDESQCALKCLMCEKRWFRSKRSVQAQRLIGRRRSLVSPVCSQLLRRS
jgi:hypothetical protein